MGLTGLCYNRAALLDEGRGRTSLSARRTETRVGKGIRKGEPMTVKEWLPLIGLAVSAFIFNTSEFMPVGLLVDIAADFRVTEAQAGILVSVYAWAVMILSLPLMIFASRFDFRRMILGVTAVFVLGQALSAAAGSYWMLMGARLVVACAHAVFWSVASPIAVRLVPLEHRPMAMSVIVVGSSIAMIAGLPLGRIIGLALGWRATFGCIAAVSLAILLYFCVVFPKLSSGAPFSVRRLPELLKNPALLALYAITVLMATGYYETYSYIEPFLQQVAGMSDEGITAALSLFGVAGVAGSALFSRFYDTRRFAFLVAAVGGIACALALFQAAALAPAAVFAICMLWGVCGTSSNVALQAEVIKCSPDDASPVAMSIYSGIFNLGIGSGTAIGGAASVGLGMGIVGYVGCAFVAISCLLCAVVLPRAVKRVMLARLRSAREARARAKASSGEAA